MARTRAADFEEKQRVILDHAAQVFADQGMEKASMSQIATFESKQITTVMMSPPLMNANHKFPKR